MDNHRNLTTPWLVKRAIEFVDNREIKAKQSGKKLTPHEVEESWQLKQFNAQWNSSSDRKTALLQESTIRRLCLKLLGYE